MWVEIFNAKSLAFNSSRNFLSFVKSALISDNMNIGTSVVVRHGVSSQWKNKREIVKHLGVQIQLFFVSLKDDSTVLCACNTNKLPHPYFRITFSRDSGITTHTAS